MGRLGFMLDFHSNSLIFNSCNFGLNGRHSDARREKTSLDLFALFVPKTVPGSRQLFPEDPRSPFGRLALLEVMHFYL